MWSNESKDDVTDDEACGLDPFFGAGGAEPSTYEMRVVTPTVGTAHAATVGTSDRVRTMEMRREQYTAKHRRYVSETEELNP